MDWTELELHMDKVVVVGKSESNRMLSQVIINETSPSSRGTKLKKIIIISDYFSSIL